MQRASQVCAEHESTVQHDKQNNRIVLGILMVGGDLRRDCRDVPFQVGG